jgi:hypothetical protein
MTWIGRVDFVEPGHDDLCFVNAIGKQSALARTASSPGKAAAATAAAATATAASAAASAASSAAAASATPGHLDAALGRQVFLVEDVECRQTDVGDFLVTERYFVGR